MPSRVTTSCETCAKKIRSTNPRPVCIDCLRTAKPTRICPICNNEFRAFRSSPNIACSKACADERRRRGYKGNRSLEPKRRARSMREKTIGLSQTSRAALLSRWRITTKCYWCGERATESVDHVVPLAQGGNHGEGNLVPSCLNCNSSKGARTVMQWRMGKPATYTEAVSPTNVAVEKRCESCSQTFKTTRSNQIYCDAYCRTTRNNLVHRNAYRSLKGIAISLPPIKPGRPRKPRSLSEAIREHPGTSISHTEDVPCRAG
jgi:hypothetical protein